MEKLGDCKGGWVKEGVVKGATKGRVWMEDVDEGVHSPLRWSPLRLVQSPSRNPFVFRILRLLT